MAPPPSWEVELDSAFSVEEVSVVRSVDFGGLKALLKGLLGGLYKEQDDLKQELSDTKARLKELVRRYLYHIRQSNMPDHPSGMGGPSLAAAGPS
jgi:hypothetical protein